MSNPDFQLFTVRRMAVFVFAHPSALTPVEDASLAVENIFLYAGPPLDRSCWIGFAASLAHARSS